MVTQSTTATHISLACSLTTDIDDRHIYAAGRTGLVNRALLWTDHVPARIRGSGVVIAGLWVEGDDVSLVGTSGFTDRGTAWTIDGDIETR